jgi:UDP-3-O-[3-hydroxymyristoyl] glucosamine N-acyltransferase
MQITVAEIGTLLQGEVVGNGQAILNKVAKIEEGEPGALSFLANPKYEAHIYRTKSTAVLVNRTFTPTEPVEAALIKVDDAYASFTYLLEQFANISLLYKTGIDERAAVAKSAQLGNKVYIGAMACVEEGAVIGENVKIFPQVYVGDRVKIGKNSIIYPGAKIYNDCVIGDDCIIHAGTVIGSDGFGFAPLADRSYKKIPQIGNVIIEDNVEIGSNCSIDRATMGSTYIRRGAKLDNLVQIAHNVEIGEHTVIASQSGVAGSTKIGKYCVIGGQVGFAGHITIADGSQFGAQSGVAASIKEPEGKWFGSPAFEYKDELKSTVVYKRLPSLEKRIQELEKIIKELQK